MPSCPSQCAGVGGGGPPGSPIMSTASLSQEQFFGPLVSVALGHGGREVPGPLVGQSTQSVPPLTLALAFLGPGQSQMWPASCCFLGLTSSEDSSFPFQEPRLGCRRGVVIETQPLGGRGSTFAFPALLLSESEEQASLPSVQEALPRLHWARARAGVARAHGGSLLSRAGRPSDCPSPLRAPPRLQRGRANAL